MNPVAWFEIYLDDMAHAKLFYSPLFISTNVYTLQLSIIKLVQSALFLTDIKINDA
jgi:predicted enzyme related to lactoylglutathione lyase